MQWTVCSRSEILSCLFSENAEQWNDGGQIRCHDWFGGSSTRCGNGGTKPGTAFYCASHSRSSVTACQIVAVGTVPQSVSQGTPRKPLQGLAVPQFHDFRRIGEKIQKKRSAHIPWESTPAVPRDRPGFRLGSERRSTDPQSGQESPTKPASRPVCGRDRKGGRSGTAERGRRTKERSGGGKTPVFLPDSGRFPPHL